MQMKDIEVALVDEDVRLLFEKLRPIIEKTMRHQGWFRKQKVQPKHSRGDKQDQQLRKKSRIKD